MKRSAFYSVACVLLLVLDGETARAQGRRGVGPANAPATPGSTPNALATSGSAPNVPVTPAFYAIPVQNYALLDVSGNDPANSPVSGIGLRDDNQLSFSVYKADTAAGYGGTYSVTKWLNGTSTAGETLKTDERLSSTYDPNLQATVITHEITRDVLAYFLPRSADGALCGNMGEYYKGQVDFYGDGSYLWVITSEQGGAFSEAGAGPSLAPPFMGPNPPMYDQAAPISAYYTQLIGSSYSGASLYEVVGYGDPNGNGYTHQVYGVLICPPSGPATLFYHYPTTAASGADLHVVNQAGYMAGSWDWTYNLVNSAGWAVVDEQSRLLWNGSSLTPLADEVLCINEGNDVLIGNQDQAHPEHLGLLRKGGSLVPFYDAGGAAGLIPAQFQKEVVLAPLTMSNRLNLPATPVQPVLQILCVGSIQRASGAWEGAYLMLRELSDGTTDLHELTLPATYGYNDVNRVNAQGVIAALGGPYGANGTYAANHALLFVPLDIEPDDAYAGGGTTTQTNAVGSQAIAADSGNVGGLVPSYLVAHPQPGVTPQKHYVSPKSTADGPGDFLAFESGLPPGMGASFHWVTDNPDQTLLPASGDATADVLVMRNQASHVQLQLVANGASTASDTMNVWVVWAEVTAARTFSNLSKHLSYQAENAGLGTYNNIPWDYKAAIQPTAMFEKSQDVPDFTQQGNIPKVPNSGAKNTFDGKVIPDPDFRWNLARQFREHDTCPTLDKAGISYPAAGLIYQGIPYDGSKMAVSTTAQMGADGYPVDQVEANDGGKFRDPKDPYVPPLGETYDSDPPSFGILYRTGSVGDTAEFHVQFREFMRLAIGSKWYRISALDHGLARIQLKFKKVAEEDLPPNVTRNSEMNGGVWEFLDSPDSQADATNDNF